MPSEHPTTRGELRLVRDARLCLLGQRDQAIEFLAWNQHQLGIQETEKWDDVLVAVVLRFQGGADDLENRFGCRILAQGGEYFAVMTKLAQLVETPAGHADQLIAHPALLEISVGRLGRPGGQSIGSIVPRVAPRAAVRLPALLSWTGQGVRLGVVDTVFDYTHAAFLDQNGLSRVSWIWDVNASGDDRSVPTGRKYTAAELRQPDFKIEQWEVYSEATVDEALARVWRTHGTIVASIAAGLAADGSFQGVASQTDLVLIGAGNETTGRIGDAADLLAGLHALMTEPGPVVANLSTADPLGPHDGTLLGERLLDELLLRPGRCVAVCAGNFGFARAASSGQGHRHDHAVVPACDGIAQFVLQFDQSLDLVDVAEIWIESTGAPEVEIAGSIEDGGQVSLLARADETPVAVTVPPLATHPCGNVLAVLTRASGAGRWCFSVFFHPAAAQRNRPPFFPASTWRFTVHGARGRVHAWLDRNNIERGGWRAVLPRAEWLASTIGAPATARRAIAVGAVDAAGRSLPSGTGLGPSLDGRLKPDLAARGEGVDAAAPGGQPPWGDSGAGTSIATPLVAGSIALLFEAWGDQAKHATWFDIRQALLRGATMPDGQGGWDPALGFGTLDMGRALAPSPRDVDLWIARTPDDDGAEPLVREFLCDGPGIAVSPVSLDGMVRVTVTVQNRGSQPTANVRVRLFSAAIGATGAPDGGGDSPWTTRNIETPAQMIDLLTSGATQTVQFTLRPPARPAMLLAVAENQDDPLPRDAAPSSCNNMALRTLGGRPRARDSGWTRVVVRGSRADDGLWLRRLTGTGNLELRGFPIGSLPWREAAIYERTGRKRRPKFGERGADPAVERDGVLENPETIRIRTDIEGATRLAVSGGRITIEAMGGELWIPRLLVARGATMCFDIRIGVPAEPDTTLGLSIYSDGRRVSSALLGS